LTAEAITKEQQVLDIATAYFLAHGYHGTSISEMARRAHVSKESIYRYFSSKEQLFAAVLHREMEIMQSALQQLEPALAARGTRDALLLLAETILGLITTDRVIALRRLVFEESGRVPDIGLMYWRTGPLSVYGFLQAVFRRDGQSSVTDPDTLGQYFISMLTGKLMLQRDCGIADPPDSEAIRQLSVAVVDDFLAAFLPSGD
jgi:TetR/AcrR family transcriptional regulator, mexJK operon transcriptional repressor